jgi:hypothetical protein
MSVISVVQRAAEKTLITVPHVHMVLQSVEFVVALVQNICIITRAWIVAHPNIT